MKIKFLLSLTLLLISHFWCGCTFNNVDDPKVVVNIEDEFDIQLWETLTPDQRSLQLRTVTLTEENCLNYSITYQVVKRNNRIRTSIDDIIEPDDCLPGKARPNVDIDLGQIENGLYEFEINLKNSTIVNSGQLVVNDDSYSVEMNSTNGIALTPEQLLRVQEGTIWGYVSAEEVADRAEAFVNEINDFVQSKDFAMGDYGYFTINETNDIDLSIETAFAQSHSFIFDYTGELSDLTTIIERFREEHGEAAELKIYTWQGEIL